MSRPRLENNGIGRTLCATQQPINEPLNDDHLTQLISRCTGHAPGFELQRVAVSDTDVVVRAFNQQSLFAALVWVERQGAEARIVAQGVTLPERHSPHSLRQETLHGERVVVEELGYACSAPENGYHLARPPSESSDRIGWVPPPEPDDCPESVERVWIRRGRALQIAGEYATLGRQRVRAGLTREYHSGVAFDGDLVRVTDNSTWWWTGGPPKFVLGWDPSVPVTAQASSVSERVYRFDGLTLEEVSKPIPEPQPQPPVERGRTFRHEIVAACAPPRSVPDRKVE